MLTAYYDCSCDSHTLFDDKKIARTDDYEKHLNQYNVIYLEITGFISAARRQGVSLREVPNRIVEALRQDLITSGFVKDVSGSLADLLIRAVEKQGEKK